MQIIVPNYILTPDTLLENQAILFDKKIQKIAPLDVLQAQYPDLHVETLAENSLLMPGLINAHVHVEFSANKTELSYGDFINWLYSVIENREELINSCNLTCMQKAIDAMLHSGITTFGAISSHAMDLEACANAKQNVVYFNELIGSQASMADALFSDFLARVDTSKAVRREGFYPAVAIHSPYSVHPILIKKALQVVRDEKLKLTAHFMESSAERDWLDSNGGDFQEFFSKFLNQNSATTKADEFLDNFNNTPTLLAHAIQTNEEELESIVQNHHTIVHCPISNRLLGNGALDIKKLNAKKIPWIVATDGLSSNYELNLFEEMKVALFMHSNEPLLEMAQSLINGVTKDAAAALGLNCGEIQEGKNADMIVLDLDKAPTEELAIHLILHQYNISRVYINGLREI